ncbi:MAG: hypothetical protein Q9209_007690 [Squamulea sp. 1 TL-2023]
MSSSSPFGVPFPGLFPSPPGVQPNSVDPEQRSGGAVPLIAVLLTLSTIFLIVRLYTKLWIVKALGWDDVGILAAWLCNVVSTASYLRTLRFGPGIHIWNIRIDLFSPYLKPVEKAYNSFVTGKCINLTPYFMISAVGNPILDLIAIVIPIPMLVRLHVNKRTKDILTSVFFISSCTITVSAVRVWATTLFQHVPGFLPVADSSWEIITALNLAVVEQNHLPWLVGRKSKWAKIKSSDIEIPTEEDHRPFYKEKGSLSPRGTPVSDFVQSLDEMNWDRKRRSKRCPVAATSGISDGANGFKLSTTSVPDALTIAPEICGACMVIADPPSSLMLSGSAAIRSALGEFQTATTDQALAAVFTGYVYISSQTGSALECSTISTSVSLVNAFTIVAGDSARRSIFSDDALSSFQSFLGFWTCAAAGPAVATVNVYGNYTGFDRGTDGESPTTSTRASMSNPTYSASNTTSIALSSIVASTMAAPTGPSVPGPTPTRMRIALGVGLSLGSLMICLSLALALRRYRKNKRLIHSSNDEDPAIPVDDQQPYLQLKGELDAHGNSKFELDAGQAQYELGATEVHEMSTGDNSYGRRELRGEEHSTELRA